jgi:hypothetical protein
MPNVRVESRGGANPEPHLIGAGSPGFAFHDPSEPGRTKFAEVRRGSVPRQTR